MAILMASSVRAEELAIGQSHDERGVLRVECYGIRIAGVTPPFEIGAMYRPPWGATADQAAFPDAATARANAATGRGDSLVVAFDSNTPATDAPQAGGRWERWRSAEGSAPESAPFAAYRGEALTTILSGSIADCPTVGAE